MRTEPENAEHVIAMYGGSLRDYQSQMLRSVPMIRALTQHARQRGAKILGDEIIFEFKGHDPRNHHGRFMYSAGPSPCVIATRVFARFAMRYFGYDPRNHTGSRL